MAESISSGRIVQKPEVVLDPNFFLPPGVTGMRLETLEERGRQSPGSIIAGSDGEVIDQELEFENPDIDSSLRPPSWIKVISQTVRKGPTGIQVVDVVIEVEDVPGVDDYQVRITKV
jgi:hypothetical protein